MICFILRLNLEFLEILKYATFKSNRTLLSHFLSVVVIQNVDPILREVPKEVDRICPYTHLTYH